MLVVTNGGKNIMRRPYKHIRTQREYRSIRATKRKPNDPSVRLLDTSSDSKPVRNRYLPEYERRIKLVRASSKDSTIGVHGPENLQEILPGVGEKKADDIWKVIKKQGRIDSLTQLANILAPGQGLQGNVFQEILPFVAI